MAIFAKPGGSKNINEVRATVQGTERGVAGTVLLPYTPSEAEFNAYAAVLNGKYRVGGSTTWERPPASGQ